MEGVGLSPRNSTFRCGDGKRTVTTTEKANTATSILNSIHNILLLILHSSDFELSVRIAPETFLDPSLSCLFDKKIGLGI